MSVLEDLLEIYSLILDLEGRDYVLSVNAYETLKRTCSQDWEAFTYVQDFLPFLQSASIHEGYEFPRMFHVFPVLVAKRCKKHIFFGGNAVTVSSERYQRYYYCSNPINGR